MDFVAENYDQETRNSVGQRIMDLTLQELFKFRYMQTDPNPANFFYNKAKDTVYLIDFGAGE